MYQTQGICWHDPNYKPKPITLKSQTYIPAIAVQRSEQYVRENKPRWEKEDNE